MRGACVGGSRVIFRQRPSPDAGGLERPMFVLTPLFGWLGWLLALDSDSTPNRIPIDR